MRLTELYHALRWFSSNLLSRAGGEGVVVSGGIRIQDENKGGMIDMGKKAPREWADLIEARKSEMRSERERVGVQDL